MAGLKWLPSGGLYLTGGLTPKNIDLIKDPEGLFMKAFMDKGRVSGMLKSVPVYAVLVEDLGERGAKFIASKLLSQLEGGDANKTESGDACAASAVCCFAKTHCNCKVLKQLLWVSLASSGLVFLSSFLKRK